MDMKKIIYIALTFTVLLTACNDDFLDKLPKDKITGDTYWNTDDDFRTYALGLYNFHGYGVGNDHYAIRNNSDETCASAMSQDDRIFNRRVVPNTDGGWKWENLRSINIMVNKARESSLLAEEKLHWEGVARFFRAREYFTKVLAFGDVPWVGKELGTSSEELFKPQDPRALVMDSVLSDLNFAVKHIRLSDRPNQINRYVAYALKSQICLFEGTFRKYHTELNLTDHEKWLRESVSASEAIMNSGEYSLSPGYRDIYSSLDLSGNTEVFLYKQYETGVIGNNRTFLMSMGPQSFGLVGGTKDAVEAFLCSDGLPYGISPLHPKAQNGEPEFLEEELVNRDPRLTMAFVVPYRDGNPSQLPAIDEGYTGNVPPFMPAFSGEGYILSASGYHPYKWWNPESPNTDTSVGILDAPLYALNEIYLNYAEAKAELNECDNNVLNQSINKLRNRVGMVQLTVEFANSIDDPKRKKYAPEITPLLWEIRRERQVELIMDGTRLNDILRWKKASYFSKPFLGAYIDLKTRPALAYNEDGTPKTTIVFGDREGNIIPGATQGYILPYYGEKQPVYSDNDLKLYYDPIPTQELTLNPNLVQSPGWRE